MTAKKRKIKHSQKKIDTKENIEIKDEIINSNTFDIKETTVLKLSLRYY